MVKYDRGFDAAVQLCFAPMSPGKVVSIAAVVLAAASVAYAAYSAHQKKVQQRALAALVDQASAALGRALQSEPTTADLEALRKSVEDFSATDVKRQRAMAQAGSEYIAGAQAIVRRRADALRLGRAAQASRDALMAHMRGASQRNNNWIQRATELKKRADLDYAELERTLTALADVLESLKEPEAELAKYMDTSNLVPASTRQAAAARARAEAKLANERATARAREEADSLERFRGAR
jgi:hypothetical protein